MSTKRGENNRSRAQKHQNRTAFRNNLHDTSHKTKFINSIQVCQVCQHCKEVIEWKIKYKKYKPLSQPKKCCRCFEKTVVHAYHAMCIPCSKTFKCCPKCCQANEVVPKVMTTHEQNMMDAEMRQALKALPERKRRTFMRFMNAKKTDDQNEEADEENEKEGVLPTKEELIEKLESLRVNDDLDDFDDFSNESEDEE